LGSCVVLGACGTTLPALMTSPLLLEFLLGAWIARSHLHGRGSPRWLGLLLLAAGSGWLVAAGVHGVGTGLGRVSWCGVPSAAVVWGVLSLERGGIRAFPRLLTRMGDTSYSLYLSHTIVMSAVGKAWKSAGLGAVCPDWLLFAALVAASLATAEISYRLIEDPLRRILSRLATGRRQTCHGARQARAEAAGGLFAGAPAAYTSTPGPNLISFPAGQPPRADVARRSGHVRRCG
jgi:exopolysaccharide production protein ExoZ